MAVVKRPLDGKKIDRNGFSTAIAKAPEPHRAGVWLNVYSMFSVLTTPNWVWHTYKDTKFLKCIVLINRASDYAFCFLLHSYH